MILATWSGAFFVRERRHAIAVFLAQPGRNRAHLEVGNLKDFIDTIALWFGFQRRRHRIAQRDNPVTVSRQEEESAGILVLANFYFERRAGIGGRAEDPARCGESIGGEATASGLGFSGRKAFISVDETNLI